MHRISNNINQAIGIFSDSKSVLLALTNNYTNSAIHYYLKYPVQARLIKTVSEEDIVCIWIPGHVVGNETANTGAKESHPLTEN